MSELKASGVIWPRFRRMLVTTTLVVGILSLGAYFLSGGRLLLDADGIVTRDHVSVSSPYESRIVDVFVRPGDAVLRGQPIASVESTAISRTLAELSIERSRMHARLAHLDARLDVIDAMIPLTESNAREARTFFDTMRGARDRGLAIERSMLESSSRRLDAIEREANLRAERIAVAIEAEGTREALRQIEAAHAGLRNLFNDGVLVSPVSGFVGSRVAAVGETLTPGSSEVARVFSGRAYVLAFVPDTYLLEVREGQEVGIRARGHTVRGLVERVLPITEALPPEFQLPSRTRERSQLVRIDIEGDVFAQEQKIRVTSCVLGECRGEPLDIIRAAAPVLLEASASLLAWVGSGFERAQESASSAIASVRASN